MRVYMYNMHDVHVHTCITCTIYLTGFCMGEGGRGEFALPWNGVTFSIKFGNYNIVALVFGNSNDQLITIETGC